jgi:hypothetical protein
VKNSRALIGTVPSPIFSPLGGLYSSPYYSRVSPQLALGAAADRPLWGRERQFGDLPLSPTKAELDHKCPATVRTMQLTRIVWG